MKASNNMDIQRRSYIIKAGSIIVNPFGKRYKLNNDTSVSGHYRYSSFYFTIGASDEYYTDPSNVVREGDN